MSTGGIDLKYTNGRYVRLDAEGRRLNHQTYLAGSEGRFEVFTGSSFLDGRSKVFPYAVARNGPIVAPELRVAFKEEPDMADRIKYLINLVLSSDHVFERENGREFMQAILARDLTLSHDAMNICKPPSFVEQHSFGGFQDFVRKFCRGDYGKLVFKPQYGSDGVNVVFLDRQTDGSILLDYRRLYELNYDCLKAYISLFPKEIQLQEAEQSSDFHGQIRIHSEQEKHLRNILDLLKFREYKPKACDMDYLSPWPNKGIALSIDCGLVQDHETFLTSNGSMIEGRYRARCMPGKFCGIEKRLVMPGWTRGSFLKVSDNKQFANGSKQTIPWFESMHNKVAEAFGDISISPILDQIMEQLLKSQLHFPIEYLRSCGFEPRLKPRVKTETDIAWSAKQVCRAETPEGDIVNIPKPILIEHSYYAADQKPTLEVSKAPGHRDKNRIRFK